MFINSLYIPLHCIWYSHDELCTYIHEFQNNTLQRQLQACLIPFVAFLNITLHFITYGSQTRSTCWCGQSQEIACSVMVVVVVVMVEVAVVSVVVVVV